MENRFFPEISGRFGMGCMRMRARKKRVDDENFRAMVDACLDAGFNYFDTARGYLGGDSERALRRCLTERHPRERYVLADKLTRDYFHSEADIRPLFESQLEACGVSYFDFYLMHAQNAEIYAHFRRHRAYETALALRAEGRIRHFGISFHDTAEVLERILGDWPQIEMVQIQLNYVDWEDPAVQSRKVYEVCARFEKPVFVMEPVKGGSLAHLPEDARAPLDALKGGGPAGYALRFAAGLPGVAMVLSGMNDAAQVAENAALMRAPEPLTPAELEAVDQVRAILAAKNMIPCTACRYCVDGCPKGIAIPDLFACYNQKAAFHSWNQDYYYREVLAAHGGKASDCVGCGRCEAACPQRLSIRALLKDVAREFEKV